ncbi:STE/STE7 protein kinase [Mycena maculata]|uniref:mitogen-activated protein kinase kinase n=1 Tax=Mycena maculata TaxID=230809 RepID=A0AAD7JZJ1_9AGAR|nr:STE/STE7 protein kinase [Mycena maculata]
MSMQTSARPVGPRAISSPSQASLTANVAPTPPLKIVKQPQRPTLSPPAVPSARSPTPVLGLSIPGVNSRPNTPKPKINIAIPALNTSGGAGQANGDAEESQGGYYSGGQFGSAVKLNSTEHEERTIRPDPPQARPEPLNSIRQLLKTLDEKKPERAEPTNGTSRENSDVEEDDGDAVHTDPQQHLPWSDDVLEEVSRLGEGAGGAVHKVRDKRTGKIMARKTITTREAPMKQLLRELSIISSTAHINIILFHGAYMSPSSSEVKILMEYCEGGSLEAVGKRIKERNAVVGEKIAGRLAEGVLQGLNYLHTKRTIHRDIKPSNILLSREGVVKLCDFGVSGELVESQAGTFTGTSFYMAPERICGAKYTIRSDVWSTGISLLELVQNRFPFPADLPPIELMMYITAGEPPRLDDEPGVQWSPEMKDFIRQTLIVDALARPTPKDMLEHPWVKNAMLQEVHMARWIRKVWEWPKTSRRSRDNTSLSRNDSSPPSSGSPKRASAEEPPQT